MYDLIIIGGGPAGVGAGIYAARKKLKTLLITDMFGGQSLVSDDIRNWVGVKSISGFELAKALEEHLRAQDGIEILEGDRVSRVLELLDSVRLGSPQAARGKRPRGGFTPLEVARPRSPSGAPARARPLTGFTVETTGGKSFEAETILVASGSRRKKLEVPGEQQFEGKGVAYCATCDAPLFQGKRVAVVGGGNAGLETVQDLIPYAAHIYLLHRRSALKGDAVTQERIRGSEKVSIVLNAMVQEIQGEKAVKRLIYRDAETGETKTLEVGGVFVEIGSVPNSEAVKDLVAVNERGEIVVDHRTQATSRPGIWAAGDVADVLYKQNNISVGDAVKAVLNIYDRFRSR